ncbi:hypothetical protein HaLaN_02052, partial [Haematococcus lacustris]
MATTLTWVGRHLPRVDSHLLGKGADGVAITLQLPSLFRLPFPPYGVQVRLVSVGRQLPSVPLLVCCASVA